MTKRAIALIPARAGSKRIANKNVYRLCGHPLIAYTISAAIESKVFDSVIVSTDSEEYARIARHYGAEVPFLRPEEFALDTSPDIGWVDFTLKTLAVSHLEFDYFSILRPTSPLRSAETIRRANREFLACQPVDSLRAIEPCAQHPAKMWTIANNRLVPIMRRQDAGVDWFSSPTQSLPEVWVQNASLEIAHVRCVTHLNSISGDVIVPFKTEFPEGLDVNRPDDLTRLEQLVKDSQELLPKVGAAPFKI